MWLDEIEEASSDYPSDSWVKRMARVLRELGKYANDLEDALDMEDDAIPKPSREDLSDDAKELLNVVG